MIWVLAFIAAVLGSALAAEAQGLFGFLSGFALVAALGLIRRQSRRIDALTRDLHALDPTLAKRPVAAPVPESAPTPTPTTASRSVPLTASVRAPAEAFVATPVEANTEAATLTDALPDAFARFAQKARAFLFEGNVPVKLGLLVSLFGIGALIRYAASAGWLTVPVSLRYAGIALAGIALLIYGLKQARKRPVFGLSLQGGAIGILLLTVFGSYRVPDLIPAGLAFVLVLGLVAGAAVLAIRQNAVWLAAIGFLGGYLAPLLLSTVDTDHVALFSYYALLNAAVFGMAWVRSWRALNLIGFAFTFGVGTLWGAQYFRPELFATTQPFLVVFFLMYVSIPVAYALKGREPGKIDATLLFGTPLIAFPMQVALLDARPMPLAFSALAVAAVYLALALWSRREEKLRVLGQSAAALGLVFATLAVPLALSARWTSATWALQGVALLWLGQAQQRRWPQVVGIGLQALAGFAYFVAFDAGTDDLAILNPHTLNLVLLVLSAGACAYLLDRINTMQRSPGGALLTAVALGWWFWAGAREIQRNIVSYAPEAMLDHGPAWLAFIALSAVLAAVLRRAVDWRKPTWLPALLLPTGVLAVTLAFVEDVAWLWQPQGLTLLALTASMVLVLPTLRGLHGRLGTAHISGLAAIVLALGLGIREALEAIQAEQLGQGWRWILPWLPLTALTALLIRKPMIAAWPIGDAITHYRRVALSLSLLVLAVVWGSSQFVAGSAAPLPWLPLLNPVELFQLIGLLGLAAYLRTQAAPSNVRTLASIVLAASAFTMMTMVTLRAAWHWNWGGFAASQWWTPMDWSSIAMWPQSQAALSVVWSLAGVICWVLGSRRGSRPLWTFGALLLGAVLLKLLLIDRSNLGDLLGIVSFLTVGGLLVIVGRLAPRPPNRQGKPA